MDSEAVSSTIARFSARFCKELLKDKSVVASPLLAEYSLALIALGAKDPAHAELLNAIGFSSDDSIRSAFSSVSEKLRSLKDVTLNVANRIYIKEGTYEVAPELLQDATKVFDAGIEKTDFNNGVAAAQLINQFVESKTNNKIKDLVSPDSINSDTRLVLVNALYFKGTWAQTFFPRKTKVQPFHVDNQKTVQVPMMNLFYDFKYGESEELLAQLLEMPYVGKEASMVIVLPREIEGLNGLLMMLADGHDLMAEINNMRTREVKVSLPKFKIETEIDLNLLLPKVGISSIFSKQNSGLDNMLSPPEPLFVSRAVQKAFIDVNERGTEAAGAGMIIPMTLCARRTPPPQFLADRPFLFLLVDSNRHVLFIGTYNGH